MSAYRSGRSVAPARPLPPETLGRLTVGVDPSGVVLGRDSAGRAVLVRLFGPEPLSVAFVGGWWATRLLVFRCLAHGAAVTVRVHDPTDPARAGAIADAAHWVTLDSLAGGSGDRVSLVTAGGEAPPASAVRPLLQIHDLGPSGPAGRPARPWHTRLTVLPRMTAASVPIVAGADVLLVQRPTEPEAAMLGSALGVRTDLVSRLPAMDNEMVAAFGAGSVRYAWLTPTPIERHLFG